MCSRRSARCTRSSTPWVARASGRAGERSGALLRPDALAGRRALVAADLDLAAHGGAVVAGGLRDEAGVAEAVGSLGGLDALVVEPAGIDDYQAALEATWVMLRESFAPLSDGGGVAVLVAPPPGDEWAAARRAALENLARVCSIEWARVAVRPVCVLPGESTTRDEIADLVAFLVSPAGDYFSGCAFSMGLVTA